MIIFYPFLILPAFLLLSLAWEPTSKVDGYKVQCQGTTKEEVLDCLNLAVTEIEGDIYLTPESKMPALQEKLAKSASQDGAQVVIEKNTTLVTPEKINYLKGVDPDLVQKLQEKFKNTESSQ